MHWQWVHHCKLCCKELFGAATCFPRRIAYRDAATGKRYVFLTNHFKLAAKTIADIYKERWQIENFFRVIKQNLKIKAFIGNSETPYSSFISCFVI